jgi:hypothetical protein
LNVTTILVFPLRVLTNFFCHAVNFDHSTAELFIPFHMDAQAIVVADTPGARSVHPISGHCQRASIDTQSYHP